ncbi:hypothetical protein [Streptomyces gibsoniae]|uniref:Uncharacterized protein n=1 Tax=Streptomyces gibsoniae TaxID=3075529 RepID=A0ABU2TLE2_9ACTN|nr:hypothetical protein [Streptomyces sp. DSM 41699]MDT0461742.1 hypothetical protein [Streptomyces sp. DSM 41699]
MPASERDEAPRRVAAGAAGVSMRDLLAACAAAKAVSTPPRDPDPAPKATPGTEVTEEPRRAA